MIRLGTALKSREYPYHRMVVISNPEATGGQIVLVRLTNSEGAWPDRDCILSPNEWAELDRESLVAYSTCKFGPAVPALEAAIARGLFEVISPPPLPVLRKIIAAAWTAKGMPPAARQWLAAC